MGTAVTAMLSSYPRVELLNDPPQVINTSRGFAAAVEQPVQRNLALGPLLAGQHSEPSGRPGSSVTLMASPGAEVADPGEDARALPVVVDMAADRTADPAAAPGAGPKRYQPTVSTSCGISIRPSRRRPPAATSASTPSAGSSIRTGAAAGAGAGGARPVPVSVERVPGLCRTAPPGRRGRRLALVVAGHQSTCRRRVDGTGELTLAVPDAPEVTGEGEASSSAAAALTEVTVCPAGSGCSRPPDQRCGHDQGKPRRQAGGGPAAGHLGPNVCVGARTARSVRAVQVQPASTGDGDHHAERSAARPGRWSAGSCRPVRFRRERHRAPSAGPESMKETSASVPSSALPTACTKVALPSARSRLAGPSATVVVPASTTSADTVPAGMFSTPSCGLVTPARTTVPPARTSTAGAAASCRTTRRVLPAEMVEMSLP